MGTEPHAPHWTAALVIVERRRAMRQPVIRALPEPDKAMTPPDMIELTKRYLGKGSLARIAMMIQAKPQAGMSIREMCRERIRWSRSRATLYRRATRGAATLTERLNEIGTSKPPGRCP